MILAIHRWLFGRSSSPISHPHEAFGLHAISYDDSHPTIGARRWHHPDSPSTPHLSNFLDSLESSQWRVARRAQVLTQRYGSKGKVSSDPYPTTRRDTLASSTFADSPHSPNIVISATSPRRHSWTVDESTKSPSSPPKIPSIPPRTLSGPLSPPASQAALWGMIRRSSGSDAAQKSTTNSDLHPLQSYLVPDPTTNSLIFMRPRSIRSRRGSLSVELGTSSP